MDQYFKYAVLAGMALKGKLHVNEKGHGHMVCQKDKYPLGGVDMRCVKDCSKCCSDDDECCVVKEKNATRS